LQYPHRIVINPLTMKHDNKVLKFSTNFFLIQSKFDIYTSFLLFESQITIHLFKYTLHAFYFNKRLRKLKFEYILIQKV